MKVDRSRGFTLIELLIVVVVIATLMGLVFRLAGVGGDQKKRNQTITRMQRLEFALSGYYAAFGSYPPVPLHGSRNIDCDVDHFGIQDVSGNSKTEKLNWPRVRAACLSQPVACEFPYNDQSPDVKFTHDMRTMTWEGGDYPFSKNIQLAPAPNNLRYGESSSWSDVQVFKFGVMSFLLPRYLFMLHGDVNLYDGSRGAQWRSQNDIRQILSLVDGTPMYSKWEDVQEATGQHENKDNDNNYMTQSKYKGIANQPSQIVCARWMQALDGIVSGGTTFYGVNTRLNHDTTMDYYHREGSQEEPGQISAIYSVEGRSKGEGGMGGTTYMLNGMTVRDAWGSDLYYYSPPPYQNYQLWSAGPNMKTMPPWVTLPLSDSSDNKTALEWLADDIVGLSTPAN